MKWIKIACFVVVVGIVQASKPAVRLRITQKGLNYAMETVVNITKEQLETRSLEDIKGHSNLLNCDYALKDMRITKIKIPTKSLNPVPSKKALHIIVRHIDLEVVGNWNYNISWFYSDDGSFVTQMKGLSLEIIMHMVANQNHLVISNVTCRPALNDTNTRITERNSWIFVLFRSYINQFAKTKIPKMACQQAIKRIKHDMNKKFSEFPVKQNLEGSITLDYSVVKNPEYQSHSFDMFFKGEFQPSDGHMAWTHEPRPLPSDIRRDRMMYLTIMDHMANSAAHTFHNKGMLKVDISAEQAPARHRTYFNTNAFRNFPIMYGLGLIHSACPSCNLFIQMEATSSPQIKTNNSGVNIWIQGITKFKAMFPNNSSSTVLALAMNVTATTVPALNGTKLMLTVEHLSISARTLKPTFLNATPERTKFLEALLKDEIEHLLEKRLGVFKVPLPVFEKFKLVKPKISYGQGYMTLESDILLI